MKHKYFISYVFKKRFGKWGFGSCFVEIYYRLNEENYDHFCLNFAEMEKVKKVVLLDFKEVPAEKADVQERIKAYPPHSDGLKARELCKDNSVCCDDNCQRCANLIYNQLLRVLKGGASDA